LVPADAWPGSPTGGSRIRTGFERKFDGERVLAFRCGDRVRLLSRNRARLDGSYPELVEAIAGQD
jgi:ATP-dependent DNA ligase